MFWFFCILWSLLNILSQHLWVHFSKSTLFSKFHHHLALVWQLQLDYKLLLSFQVDVWATERIDSLLLSHYGPELYQRYTTAVQVQNILRSNISLQSRKISFKPDIQRLPICGLVLHYQLLKIIILKFYSPVLLCQMGNIIPYCPAVGAIRRINSFNTDLQGKSKLEL